MFNLLTIILAILGLGFLVFIHELGHYWVARRQGMRVEAFAIGFGKPIFTWVRDGVKWHICMLPFGGYVKIAGMQKEGNIEPSLIPDGFFGKTPWQRIKVALAGPLVNIIFSVLVFTALWLSGGRSKQFAEFTHRIGWVDTKSELYQHGVRPGDVIEKYDGRAFHGFKDLLVAALMSDEKTQIEGHKINYLTGKSSDFNYTLDTYKNTELTGKDKLSTIGVISPARYLIFDGQNFAGSPASESGIQPKDRILWIDGEVVFSPQQLSALTNASTAFLTVQRGEKIFQTKVPRVKLDELKMTGPEKGEIDDWQHEAELKGKLQDLYFIPYNLSPTAEVEARLNFIDEQDQIKAFQRCERCAYFYPLEEGDRILAVDGKEIKTAYQALSELQTRHVFVIVDRNPSSIQQTLWTQAENEFDQFNTADLKSLVSSIGTNKPLTEAGTLHLLKPITPRSLRDFPLTQEQKAQLAQELAQKRKEIEDLKDPEKQREQLLELEKSQSKVILGLPLVDRVVRYNPTPQAQFVEVFKDTWRTLAGLLSGVASPKYMSGPVGIIQVVHQSWTVGVKEALFWMALISLNLGFLNLLPLPVLDGGHIVFSLVEMVTRKPMKAKTMERLILPFVVLLIGFFIYVTYHDISRIFSKFF